MTPPFHPSPPPPSPVNLKELSQATLQNHCMMVYIYQYIYMVYIYIHKNKDTDLIGKLVEQQPVMTVEDDLPWCADQKNVQQAIAIYVILSSTAQQNTVSNLVFYAHSKSWHGKHFSKKHNIRRLYIADRLSRLCTWLTWFWQMQRHCIN